MPTDEAIRPLPKKTKDPLSWVFPVIFIRYQYPGFCVNPGFLFTSSSGWGIGHR
jgi:hypothetical protein